MKTKAFCLIIAALMLVSFSACAEPAMPAPEEDFSHIADYQQWAEETGYPSGDLTDDGMTGVNQDVFRTLPGEPGYDSGRIVIGDSRCCQLGIYAKRAGLGYHATFAVWGGHYTDREPHIPTEEFYSAVEACFSRQIEICGKCTIFFFATVNDYDHVSDDNAENIGAALDCVLRLAHMVCIKNGREYHPRIIVIGIEGGAEDDASGWLPEDFNRYVDSYNAALEKALLEGEYQSALTATGAAFAYTPFKVMSNGELDFIDDGLHYGDRTLRALESTIRSS